MDSNGADFLKNNLGKIATLEKLFRRSLSSSQKEFLLFKLNRGRLNKVLNE